MLKPTRARPNALCGHKNTRETEKLDSLTQTTQAQLTGAVSLSSSLPQHPFVWFVPFSSYFLSLPVLLGIFSPHHSPVSIPAPRPLEKGFIPVAFFSPSSSVCPPTLSSLLRASLGQWVVVVGDNPSRCEGLWECCVCSLHVSAS